ncbi:MULTISPECIES: DNA-binding protein [Bacillus]|uniref:DNA-binding protein n=1 Tax=Bacillus TaxID=1386 RepID=UPI00119E5620|nr:MULTISPECIES: DNA-binding protein [Bacillus]MED1575514.1 DNA-binding protein [Bacillus safensis]
MDEPKMLDCLNKIRKVLEGTMTREQISDWVEVYVSADDPEIDDDQVWDMLVLLSEINLKDSPNSYLHSVDDLNDWLEKYK